MHSTRTAWSVSKDDFKASTNYDKNFLGIMDFIFLFSYAMSLKAGGGLGDKYNLKYYLGLGMIPASLFLSSIAVMGLCNFHNKVLFGLFMCLNGIF